MKKIIFLIIMIILTNHNYANAKLTAGYFGYSYSKEEMDEKNVQNHSIGQEIFFESDFFDSRIPWFLGLNYKFGDNGKSLASHFLIFNPSYVFDTDLLKVGLIGCFFIPTIGTNVSYNLDKKIWGIGPQIDLVNIIFVVFKLNITYRYNIYFKAENTHEIGFTFSIIDYIGPIM